jgi:hypothetical protein
LKRAAALLDDARLLAAVERVLDDCPTSYLQFVFELACAAGVGEAAALGRAEVVAFSHGAVEFADDLSDGDCPPELDAARHGPVVLFSLLQLALSAACDAELPHPDLGRASALACAMASAQSRELDTRAWTAQRAEEAARGLNGAQFEAYLALLWSGTPLAPRAAEVGADLGLALHVLSDAASGDARLLDLRPPERAALVGMAEGAAERLSRAHLAPLRRLGEHALAELRALRPGAQANLR